MPNKIDLRSQIIKLAHEHPEFRSELLPILKEAGCEKLPEGGMRDNCEKKVEEGKKNDKKSSRTAAKHGLSVREHIEDGLVAIVEGIAFELGSEFLESIRFGTPSVTGRMRASVEGAIEWRPDPSRKGYILVSFGLDQFDLHKAEIFLSMDLPSGKSFQKGFNAGSNWLDKPALMNGASFARALKGWIDSFFTGA